MEYCPALKTLYAAFRKQGTKNLSFLIKALHFLDIQTGEFHSQQVNAEHKKTLAIANKNDYHSYKSPRRTA